MLYALAVLFALGARACCFGVNIYFMKHPLAGEPVSFSGNPKAAARNHLFGIFGGVWWGCGGCLNFVAADRRVWIFP
jgi:glucose uptake protein